MILAIDLILATFRGKRTKLRLPAGANRCRFLCPGACLSCGASLFWRSASTGDGNGHIEGAIWGSIAGAGTVWILHAVRDIWWKFFAVIALSGLALSLSDLLWKGPLVTAPLHNVFIAGIVMPLFLIGSALLGRLLQKEG